LPSALGSATYDAANELVSADGTQFTYDATGQLTSDEAHTYGWDARGELASLDGGATTYTYDPLGRRVAATTSATRTTYRYDESNVLSASSPTETTSYLSGLALDQTFLVSSGSDVHALLTDALGSTLGLVASTGSLSTRYAYDPFGGTSVSGETTTNALAFAGRELDSDGLYDMRARMYAPTIERFLSRDPLGVTVTGPAGYQYALNDPTDLIDPTGEGQRDLWWLLCTLGLLCGKPNDVPGAPLPPPITPPGMPKTPNGQPKFPDPNAPIQPAPGPGDAKGNDPPEAGPAPSPGPLPPPEPLPSAPPPQPPVPPPPPWLVPTLAGGGLLALLARLIPLLAL
jgi:RHS repeat-associated protein